MDDRELLEKAAKAAGYSCWQSKHGYLNVTRPDGSKFTACNDWPKFDAETGEKLPAPTLVDAVVADNWCPLTDDGDALRLANKLWLEVRHVHGKAHAGMAGRFWCTENWFPDMDQDAATRRAIVRAAASLADAQEGR